MDTCPICHRLFEEDGICYGEWHDVAPRQLEEMSDNCTCYTGTGLSCPRHDPRYGEPESETGPVVGRRFGPAFVGTVDHSEQ